MFDNNKANSDALDFFQELENIGVSHAATALSTMLNREVSIRVPCAKFCEYDTITNILNGPESIVVGLLVSIFGDIDGFILLILDEKDARDLSQSILMGIDENISEDGFSELQISALKEVSNILIGSYITAISTLTGFRIDASVPDMVVDMAGAILNLITTVYGEYGDTVLFLETEFLDQASSIFGHFFLVPDVESFNKLISKMEVL